MNPSNDQAAAASLLWLCRLDRLLQKDAYRQPSMTLSFMLFALVPLANILVAHFTQAGTCPVVSHAVIRLSIARITEVPDLTSHIEHQNST
jgi:hypothetical protein